MTQKERFIGCKNRKSFTGSNCTIIPAVSTVIGKSGNFTLEHAKYDRKTREWSSKLFDVTDLQLGIVSKEVWMRGGHVKDCVGKNETSPWIMNPDVRKVGYEKAKIFEDFKSCF